MFFNTLKSTRKKMGLLEKLVGKTLGVSKFSG